MFAWHVAGEHKPADEFDNTAHSLIARVKRLIYVDDFVKLFSFLEFLLRSDIGGDLSKGISAALISSRAAWRVAEGLIDPVSSEFESQAVVNAIETVATSGPAGAKTHLGNSARLLAKGDWAGSVRESVHAIESTARSIEGSESLKEALRRLQQRGTIMHPALAKGFEVLFGYASDEEGVRHSLIESGAAPVTEAEAQFMFGASASFCQYLLNCTSAKQSL